MARELKTGWVCIATSGMVAFGKEDGRTIEREWLSDMAEVFNTKLFTPMVWPEHRRYYTLGKVLALKVQEATDPELAGELQLFAILAPNSSWMYANQSGDYLFCSIEVGENFRGTGKYFLKGLGATDEPASVGVTELKFNKNGREESAIVFPAQQFDLLENIDKGQEQTLASRIFNIIKPKETPEETPMAKQDFSAITAAIESLQAKLDAVITPKPETVEEPSVDAKFAALTAEVKALKAQLNPAPEGGAPNAELEQLKTEFAALKTQLEEALKEVPGTQGGDTTTTEEVY